MKILLIGEYSNVHWTLAEGLRHLGHKVTVVSNGDFWKDYQRDIDISRKYNKISGIIYMIKVYSILTRLRGFDIVQIINPMFLELRAEHIFPIYKYLRRHNKKMVLGAFGMDYYWVNENITRKPLRYSDFNIGDKLRTNNDALKERKDWIGTAKEQLNKMIANDADLIVTGLYEYHVCYVQNFKNKTVFIPFPIKMEEQPHHFFPRKDGKLHLFIGINKNRSEYKGTDIMLTAAKDIVTKYPSNVDLQIAENIPFNKYKDMMNGADAILDQLYSYTPSMNPLLAMSKVIICIGGGEPENYQIIKEDTLKPIINVLPNYKSVYCELEKLIINRNRIPLLKEQSMEYIAKHHDYIKVAKLYEKEYIRIL